MIKAILQRLKRRTWVHPDVGAMSLIGKCAVKLDAIGDAIAILLERGQDGEREEIPLANGLIPGQMYLHLYHGRKQPDQKLNDWGEDGPYIGPLDGFIDTYRCNPRILFCRFEDQQKFFPQLLTVAEAQRQDNVCEPLELHLTGKARDLIEYNGMHYGDYEVVIARDHG